MIDTKGYAAQSSKSPVAPWNFKRRELKPKDVQIDILYCGICHSDLHQVRDEWGGSTYPMVPGHEIVGRVTQVGAGVKKLRAGELAGVGCMVDSCRDCAWCRRGEEQFCAAGASWTYNSHERD